MNSLVLILIVVVVVLNAYATWRILRSDDLERLQKYAQGVIVWLLPLLGSMLVIYFLNNAYRMPSPPKSPFGGGANDSMPGGVQ